MAVSHVYITKWADTLGVIEVPLKDVKMIGAAGLLWDGLRYTPQQFSLDLETAQEQAKIRCRNAIDDAMLEIERLQKRIAHIQTAEKKFWRQVS